MPGTLLLAKYALVNTSDPGPVWVRAPAGSRWHMQRVISEEGHWVGLGP